MTMATRIRSTEAERVAEEAERNERRRLAYEMKCAVRGLPYSAYQHARQRFGIDKPWRWQK